MSRTRAYLSVICPCLPVIPWLNVIVLAASRILLRRHRRTFHLLRQREAHSLEDPSRGYTYTACRPTNFTKPSREFQLFRVFPGKRETHRFADFHPCAFHARCRCARLRFGACALEIRPGARATPRWTPPAQSPVAGIQPRLRPTASVRASIGSPNTRHTLRRRTRTVGDAQT